MDNLKQIKLFCIISASFSVIIPIAIVIFFDKNSKIADLLILIFIASFVFALVTGLLLYIGKCRNETILGSFFSLADWTKRNDIGSATNIVDSLSNNQQVKEFFNGKYIEIGDKINNQKRDTPLINKNIYLISEIPDIIKVVDNATKEDLVIIKKFIEFESTKNKLWEKLANKILNLSIVAGLAAGYKYGLEKYFLDKQKTMGFIILISLIVISLLLFCIWFKAHRSTQREKNARNFLYFIFNFIE